MEKPLKKKKKTFLGFLMRIFIFFVFLIIVSISVFYYKKKTVTVWSLQMYAPRLANAMTSEKYYQITSDPDYKVKYDGLKGEASFDEKKEAQLILENRQKEAQYAFEQFIKSYEQNSDKEWLPIFSEIKDSIKTIFMDHKVSSEEYQMFLSKISGYSK